MNDSMEGWHQINRLSEDVGVSDNELGSSKSVHLKPLPRSVPQCRSRRLTVVRSSDSWIGINIENLRPILIEEIRCAPGSIHVG